MFGWMSENVWLDAGKFVFTLENVWSDVGECLVGCRKIYFYLENVWLDVGGG